MAESGEYNHGEAVPGPDQPASPMRGSASRRNRGCPTGRAPGPAGRDRSSWHDRQDPSLPTQQHSISRIRVRKLKSPPGQQEADVSTASAQDQRAHHICAWADWDPRYGIWAVWRRGRACTCTLDFFFCRLSLRAIASFQLLRGGMLRTFREKPHNRPGGSRKDAGREWCSSGLGCMDRRCQLQAGPPAAGELLGSAPQELFPGD